MKASMKLRNGGCGSGIKKYSSRFCLKIARLGHPAGAIYTTYGTINFMTTHINEPLSSVRKRH